MEIKGRAVFLVMVAVPRILENATVVFANSKPTKRSAGHLEPIDTAVHILSMEELGVVYGKFCYHYTTAKNFKLIGDSGIAEPSTNTKSMKADKEARARRETGNSGGQVSRNR